MKIVVLAYPRIANFDDFDPLRLEPGVDLVFVRPGEPLPGDAALVILPGSKATIADLAALRAAGWDIDLRRMCGAAGVCSASAAAIRCSAAASPIRRASKARRRRSRGSACWRSTPCWKATRCWSKLRAESDGVPFKGYEMHVGRTTGVGHAAARARRS